MLFVYTKTVMHYIFFQFINFKCNVEKHYSYIIIRYFYVSLVNIFKKCKYDKRFLKHIDLMYFKLS